ncbi:hypothetical protein B0H15DRAFT_930305 [Mycena belliarum]|uniref:Zn(2)-C6 fungal-type domain-containing protein n=1 Tax=Mycena belliarum TaxID=1033014 RepID=A0AAD6XQ14_9AGAR|nr:hypothetical protein B0H15DRAFT_930305 [Mycena belliae]
MSQGTSATKQRLRGACDICRRQKVRCDSARMPGQKCTNCLAFNSECTHDSSQYKEKKDLRRKRTANLRPEPVGEQVFAGDSTKIKNIVNRLLSQPSSFKPPKDYDTLFQLLLEVARYARTLEEESESSRRSQASSSSSPTAAEGELESVVTPNIVEIVVDSQVAAPEDGASCRSIPRSTRPEFWLPDAWEANPEPPATTTFPPDDLLWDLVEIYFTEVNIFWCILNRPCFEKAILDGLHQRDPQFGAVVLAVCALGSKTSPDERVLLNGAELSAGYKWFNQIRRPLEDPEVKITSLHDVQVCCLYILFYQGSLDYESYWFLSRNGLLQAQDVASRQDPHGPPEIRYQTARCISFLAMSDAICSAFFGKPRVAHSFDFPIPGDSEYREDTEKQADYVVAYTRLIGIVSLSWLDKGPIADYSGRTRMDAETLAALDTRLNKWAEEIPEHLLWNPYMKNDIFFDQSAALYAAFYHIQIVVHRTRPTTQGTSFSLKSLAVCANAARSCSQVVDAKSRRGTLTSGHPLKAAFESAVVLLLNISSGTRCGLSINTVGELVDVYKCMTLLRQSERRWKNAGRYYDSLCELLANRNLPLPSPVSSDLPSTEWTRTAPLPAETPAPRLIPEQLSYLPMAVEDLGQLPIYESLNSSEFTPADIATGAVHPPNIPGYPGSMSTTNAAMEPYMAAWLPYHSNLDEVIQMMLNTSTGS